MSSTPRKADARKAGPPPEKKAPAGPVVTPQVLGIILGIILVIGVVMYYNMVIKKFTNEKAQLSASISQTQLQIDTYRKKGSKLETARDINTAIREKLSTLDYLFLEDQTSIVPFFENSLLPLLETSRLTPGIIKAEEFEFKLNMAMQPFKTLPATTLFEDAASVFPIEYDGEKNGVPTESPLDTRPGTFIMPYNLTFEEFAGTYEDARAFVEQLQTSRQNELITVHCIKNDDSANAGIYRTSTLWTIQITVYFMNPEKNASGEEPPGKPGSETC